MTHRDVEILPDGRHRYADGHVYTPVPEHLRKKQVRKPPVPGAVRYNGDWFAPLALLEDGARRMPETVPDDETLEHDAICTCFVCRRPQAKDWWRRARRIAYRRGYDLTSRPDDRSDP